MSLKCIYPVGDLVGFLNVKTYYLINSEKLSVSSQMLPFPIFQNPRQRFILPFTVLAAHHLTPPSYSLLLYFSVLNSGLFLQVKYPVHLLFSGVFSQIFKSLINKLHIFKEMYDYVYSFQ